MTVFQPIPFGEGISDNDISKLLADFTEIKDNNTIKDLYKYTVIRFFIIDNNKKKFNLGGLLLQTTKKYVYIKKFKGMIMKIPFKDTIFYVKNDIDRVKYNNIIKDNNKLIEILGGDQQFSYGTNISDIMKKMDFWKPTKELEEKIKDIFPELEDFYMIDHNKLMQGDVIRCVTLDLKKCLYTGFIIELDKEDAIIKMILVRSSTPGNYKDNILWNIKPNMYFIFTKETDKFKNELKRYVNEKQIIVEKIL